MWFQAGGGTFGVVAVMLLVGALVGAVNGCVFVYGRLPHPFIITLATLSIARGLALEISDGRAVQGMPEAIRWLGRDGLYGLPGSVLVVIGTAVVLLVLTQKMVWGRWLYAVVGRQDAASRMGIPVNGCLSRATFCRAFARGSVRSFWPGAPLPDRRCMAICWNSTPSPQ